jgi:integrase
MREGKTISFSEQHPSDAAAKKAFRSWRVGVDEGTVAPASGSVAELMDQWLEHKKPHLSPTTMRLYEGIVAKHIALTIGRRPLNKLTARDLDKHYRTLGDAGVGQVTVHKVHLVLHGALRQAIRWGMIGANPATNATPPPVPLAQTEEKTPSRAAVDALIVAAKANDVELAALIHCAAATGARRGELIALRWNDLDLKVGTMAVRRSIVAVRGSVLEKSPKSGKGRRVALDTETITVIKQHRRQCKKRASVAGAELADDAFVFSPRPGNTEGWHPSSVTHLFSKLAKSTGYPDVTFHGLRHFHCTELIGGGVDVVTVGARVGHARPSITTDIYSHALPEKDRDAAALIGQIMATPKPRTRRRKGRAQPKR